MRGKSKIDAVLIAGPTASGKSALALALAERANGMLINADSMQVYANVRVLTARPSPADEARVPHRLFGHVDMRDAYSAGRYAREAALALAEAREKHRLPIFVGGTGLYFGALEEGLAPIPPVPAEIRARVRARYRDIGAAAFHAELAEHDPGTAARVSARDPQRLTRAREVLEATGRTIRDWQSEASPAPLNGLCLARFVLAPPRGELYARIEARFDAMMAAGALDEVRALAGLDASLPAAKALGIPPLQRHLAGEVGLSEAVAEAKRQTRNYAKRQMTWFRRRMGDWKWLESSDFGNNLSVICEIAL